jgi:hypothetical protein
MKTMIRNSSFNCINFLGPGLLILLLSSQLIAEENILIKNTLIPDSEKTHSIPPLYTNLNEQIALSENEKYLVILKTNKNCIDCFYSINNQVMKIKSELPDTKFIVITLIDSSSLERKRNYHTAKILLPGFDEFFFQYNKPDALNFFKIWKTYYSPEILIIKHGIVTHIPYTDVFTNPNLQISDKVNQAIIEQLK